MSPTAKEVICLGHHPNRKSRSYNGIKMLLRRWVVERTLPFIYQAWILEV